MLDLQTPSGIADFRRLLASADILLDASSGAVARALGVQPGAIAGLFPGLITTRITPFGDVGPWKDHKASDLVHLALGGIMMNCGYDPDPARHYDMPPIAPQLWHAYHIAGDQAVVGIIAALMHRLHTSEGQDISVAIHDAVSKNTELDVMSWVMRHAPLYRQTCRHAIELSLKFVIDHLHAAGMIAQRHKADHDIESHWAHLHDAQVGDARLADLIGQLQPFVVSLAAIDAVTLAARSRPVAAAPSRGGSLSSGARQSHGMPQTRHSANSACALAKRSALKPSLASCSRCRALPPSPKCP
jgi:hypothetical protein